MLLDAVMNQDQLQVKMMQLLTCSATNPMAVVTYVNGISCFVAVWTFGNFLVCNKTIPALACKRGCPEQIRMICLPVPPNSKASRVLNPCDEESVAVIR